MLSDWLVFCDCGFQSVCPLMDEDKRLAQALWWEGLAVAVGKLGLALVGRAMLSKSLIQFSADGWSCAPSLLVVWPTHLAAFLATCKYAKQYCYCFAPFPSFFSPFLLFLWGWSFHFTWTREGDWVCQLDNQSVRFQFSLPVVSQLISLCFECRV